MFAGSKADKPGQELLRVIKEWDDTSEATRLASRQKLDALGPQSRNRLVTWLRHRALRSRFVTYAGLTGMLLPFLFAMGWLSTLPRYAPIPSLLVFMLVLPLIVMIALLVFVGRYSDGNLSRKAIQALSYCEDTRLAGILALMSTTRSDESEMRQAFLASSQKSHLLPTSLPAMERRAVRALSLHSSPGSQAAALRILTSADDGSALKAIRKLHRRTCDWEVRQAAEDYLVRWDPEYGVDTNAEHGRGRLPASPDSHDATPPQSSVLDDVMLLGSRSAPDRQAAEAALHHLSSEELPTLLRFFGQEPQEERSISKGILGAWGGLGGVAGAGTVLLWQRIPYFDARAILIFTIAFAIAGGAIGVLQGSSEAERRRNRILARMLGRPNTTFPRKRLLEVLSTLENVALVGALIDALPSPNALTMQRTRNALIASLIRLLPRLHATDAHLLNARQRQALNQELNRPALALSDSWATKSEAQLQANFDIAILKAWEQVGDEDALPIVQKLIARLVFIRSEKGVREAAQQCLPYLEMRADRQQIAQTLLRAAEVPQENGAVLLRAAETGGSDAVPKELLRAGYSGDASDANA